MQLRGNKKLLTVARILLPLVLGFIPLVRVLDDHRSQAIRGVDILRLIAVGLWWGLALAAIFRTFVPRFRKE